MNSLKPMWQRLRTTDLALVTDQVWGKVGYRAWAQIMIPLEDQVMIALADQIMEQLEHGMGE